MVHVEQQGSTPVHENGRPHSGRVPFMFGASFKMAQLAADHWRAEAAFLAGYAEIPLQRLSHCPFWVFHLYSDMALI